ncbi:MAG: homocysteine S-methyltransferase family protein [Isosphaeraceae bacterium]
MDESTSPLMSLFPPGWILADGAWGTELQARGMPASMPPDLANIDRPGDVEAVARSYVEAGSQVILTNTFRSNRIALEPFGKADLARRLNRLGARISRSAEDAGVRVFGSIGPAGRLATPNALRQAFREQAEALAEEGVDALVCETFTDPIEAALAIEAARSTGLPVVASFAFVGGLEPERAGKLALDAGVDAVGANCIEPGAAQDLIRRLRAATGLPIWIKPNAGFPSFVEGLFFYPDVADSFAASLTGWLEAGADFVGGCCGTSPGLIHTLSAHRPRGGR